MHFPICWECGPASTSDPSAARAAREQGFKIGLLVFAGDNRDLDLLETGFLQEAVERAFPESEPDVGVEFPGLFKAVLFQVEHEQMAAGAQDARGFVDGGLRMLRVVQACAFLLQKA